MADKRAFEEAYEKLNAAQREAVDTVYGPVMVIAGPGTGKTQILAVRIANILRIVPAAKPDEIVALTYTESAVASMRTRLAGLIGAAAYRVHIHTFHGFARLILSMRPDLFPRIENGVQLNDVSAVELMEQLLDSGDYTRIRNPKDPYRLAKKLVSFMSVLKREHKTPDGYQAELESDLEALMSDPERMNEKGAYAGKEKTVYRAKRERLEKHLEVASLYGAYEEALREGNLYDYEDLIGEAVRGLAADESFRADVGEQMQFVLADEHQDANPAQNSLLELVTDFDGTPNLFVVGDEKQAIYRFQGASIAAFFYFKDKYPDAKIIQLTHNYRSTSQILGAAHDLIAPAPIPHPELRAKLKAVAGEGARVAMLASDTPLAEMRGIATYIDQKHRAGVPYTDIAVLTRTNADVLALAEYLRSVSIPEDHASAELDALAHPAIRLFIDLIRAVADPKDSGALGRALFIPGFPASLDARLRALGVARERRPLREVLEESDPLIASWMRAMLHAGRELRPTPALAWLARLATESGFLSGLLAMRESADAYSAYEAFMEEARIVAAGNPVATALDVLRHIDLIEAHELSIKRAREKRNGVSIMTAHHAKGMEFPYVVIALASDERWFGKRTDELSLATSDEGDEHDIRRLFYVALTRAKKEVLITYSRENTDARALTPLRFLADLATHLDEVASDTDDPPLHTPHVGSSVLDPAYLRERFLAQGLSPTGFNNYKASPWLYLFRTLLQIPDVPNRFMQFGTAVHAGLKRYADALGQGSASAEDAVRAFGEELTRLPLAASDRAGLYDAGAEALRAYLVAAPMENVLKTEFPVSVPFEIPGTGDITLSGKLDRIDGNQGEPVVVIDYKTGKAKSENEIRGATKSSTGDYYRQLVFYKLLLARDGRYQMGKGALHFVEPTDSGKIVIREFVITDEEVAQLEQDIREAAEAIVSGAAFTVPPDPAELGDYAPILETLFST